MSSSDIPLNNFISIAQSVASAFAPTTTSASSSASSTSASSSTSISTTSTPTAAASASASAAASPTSAPSSHGLSDRNKTIIIAVCTVVGALLLGILIGCCVACCLRRRRRRAKRNGTPEATGIRGGDWEKNDNSHHGFSHWNGRRMESYTPVATNHVPLAIPGENARHSPRPNDAEHPAFRSSNEIPITSPPSRSPRNSNPFVPQPPPARKAVGSPPREPNGRHDPAMAAGLGALAGAAAARHHERNKKQYAPYHEYETGYEEQPLNGYDAHQEHQTVNPYNDISDNYDNMHHSADHEQTTYDPTYPERDPNRPPTPFGLAAFSDSTPSQQHHSHGAIEPTVSDHTHQHPQHLVSSNSLNPHTSTSTSDAHSSFPPDSHPGFFHPTEAQRRSLHERDMRDMASPAQEPTYVHPPVPERSPKRASFLESSSRGSNSPRVGSNSHLVPQQDQPATSSPLVAQPPKPGHNRNDSGRMSFSRPRPEAYDEPYEYHSQQSSSGESWGNRATPHDMPGGWLETPGLEQPPVPWDTAASQKRGSSESRRSFGPDGKPRRLRVSDIDERGGYHGVGQAL